ncbi:hypothetical protein FHR84_000721 [Actinopolyspora biskrensis]|uniref:Uncharacterized protein n=1 Tax=Actinopolyspora biskrensis TaxID=1470178 RepID=A0A852Z4V6_9ACTN|nr:hypothetical protein [Actinopolyspora biskrensis]NYH77407.1 hypothetical protein [Actinopolyspora biskrensis]
MRFQMVGVVIRINPSTRDTRNDTAPPSDQQGTNSPGPSSDLDLVDMA